MSIASVAAQQSAAAASSRTAASTGSSALASLSGNLNTFLDLLMTQLQNQDPTSPLDSSQFTSQLVQYSSVEQQIQTNSNLTNLLQVTQGNEVVQSANLLGKQVEVSSDHLSLQSGKATVKFAGTAGQTVSVVVLDSTGRQVATDTLTATAGSNSWRWDGKTSAGNSLPDGSYRVLVRAQDSTGGNATLATTVVGTVTNVAADGSSVQVQLGALSVDFSKLRSLQS